MKKLMLVVVAVIVAFSALGFAAGTPVAPASLPMLRDPAALREYALAQVVRGTRSVWAPSLDWDDPASKLWAEVTGNGAEEVLEKLLSEEQALRYTLLNPQDVVAGHIWLYNAAGYALFYGSAQHQPGVFQTRPQYSVWMQSVPVASGVASAEVLVLSEDGTTVRRIPQLVRGDKVFVDAYLAGAQNGVLVLSFASEAGNTVVSYDLWQPEAERPGSFTEPAGGYKVQGHHVFTDVPLVKVVEVKDRPTVFLRLTQTEDVTFDVAGIVQEGGVLTAERPMAIVLSSETDRELMGVIPTGGEVQTIYSIPPGRYRIRFEWESFARPGRLYDGPIPPTDGYGEG